MTATSRADAIKEKLANIRKIAGDSGVAVEEPEPTKLSVVVSAFQMIPVTQIHPDEKNPNVQTEATFNALVEEIRTEGFDEPLQICHCTCPKLKGPHYVISGGEHRWQAVQVLGMTEIPASVKDWDEEKRRLKMVRRNLMRGDLDDRKFTELVAGLKANDAKWTDEALAREMGFDDQQDYLRHLLQKNAEEEGGDQKWLRQIMSESSQEINAVDALSDVLNNLFRQFGDTVPQSYMLFTHGGKTHFMVIMDDVLYETVTLTADKVKKSGANMAKYLTSALQAALKEAKAV